MGQYGYQQRYCYLIQVNQHWLANLEYWRVVFESRVLGAKTKNQNQICHLQMCCYKQQKALGLHHHRLRLMSRDLL